MFIDYFLDARVETGCQNFYRCVYVGTAYERVYEFTCPPGTLFDSSIMNCNWPYAVTCL